MVDVTFEDFEIGQIRSFGAYEVTRAEIIEFATEFDPQPFHLDDEVALASPLGGLAASGWHTAAMGMRMIADNILAHSTSMGAPGIDAVRWLVPVRPGDRLRIESRVTATRVSASRPTMGIVSFDLSMFNQADVCVMTQTNAIMFGRREGAPR